MLIKDTTATPIDYLRTPVGRDNASFREEQLECIEAAVRGERLLVVQRTAWGKSIVYFIATRLLRDRGAGPTLIVSPLLSLCGTSWRRRRGSVCGRRRSIPRILRTGTR